MNVALKDFEKYVGEYLGTGLNHEKQDFSGRFCLRPLLASLAYEITFIATGSDGTVYHEEKSIITHAPRKELGLWSISNNTPFMLLLEFRGGKIVEDTQTLIFGLNDPNDKASFREEIHLELAANKIGYHYYWGLPGGEFAYRSGLTMKKLLNN